MAIEVKLQAFEGPLDLLLHLIDKNKVNIYDIPIALITEQYMAYIDAMTEADVQMDLMSEFLVMAATLLDIKSRMLLPAEKDEEGEEIDPREELVRQLLEYKTYKYMSFELREREAQAEGVYFRRQSIPSEVRQYREPVDPDKVLDQAGVTLQDLPGGHAQKRRSPRSDPSQFRKDRERADRYRQDHAVRGAVYYEPQTLHFPETADAPERKDVYGRDVPDDPGADEAWAHLCGAG